MLNRNIDFTAKIGATALGTAVLPILGGTDVRQQCPRRKTKWASESKFNEAEGETESSDSQPYPHLLNLVDTQPAQLFIF
ncbi:hypothetical protein V498_00207 [Pseudogymnoascus sp. VKM F-4517 (FW-2822)]|nr:hypothetical protein V498_00207 [Pseudogymnoascus sp. VKM F-4517 (FW-2822)]